MIEPHDPYVQPFQQFEPKKSEAPKIIKATFYLLVSIFKGFITALLITIWLMVGAAFAMASLDNMFWILNAVDNFKFLIIFILTIFHSTLAFKKIKRTWRS